MSPFRFAGRLSLLAVNALVTPIYAVSYQATLLHPTQGYSQSAGFGIAEDTQVGYGISNNLFPFDDDYHAMMWKGTSDSVVDLHPFALGFPSSEARDASSDSQVGSGYYYPAPGHPTPHALLWHGTANSVVDLNPIGFTESDAVAVSGNSQGGQGRMGTVYSHALLWHGTPESVVDLSPVGYYNSAVSGIDGNVQVGAASINTNLTRFHALLWHGTAESVVDINPASFLGSIAFDISGNSQVGYGYEPVRGLGHALLWHGTADSAIDLNPAGFG